MKIKDLKGTKKSTILVAARIPKKQKAFLDKHDISFTVFVTKALDELMESSTR